MALLDKLIDKIFARLKKNKADKVIMKIRKDNPAFAKAMDRHQKSYAELKKQLQKSLPGQFSD